MTQKRPASGTDDNDLELEATGELDPITLTRRGFTLSSAGGIAALLLGSACGTGTEEDVWPEDEDRLDEQDDALSAATDLVGYWTFDDGDERLLPAWSNGKVEGTVCAGALSDWSGSRRDGEFFGPQWVSEGGRKYLSFDGIDDLAELPHKGLNPGSPMTILMAYKRTDASENGRLFQYHTNVKFIDPADGKEKPKTVGFSLDSKFMHFAFTDGDFKDHHVPWSSEMPKDTWVVAAVTISSTEMKLYKDGLSNDKSTRKIQKGIRPDGGRVLTVGRQEGVERFFKGSIGGLAILRRVLSDAEIKAVSDDFHATGRLTLATPYNDLTVGAVSPNKLVYRQGEAGTVRVVVKNFSSTPVTTTPYLEGIAMIGTGRRLHTAASRTFAPGETANLTFPFTLLSDTERFQLELRAIVRGYRGSHVAVSDNFWEVGLGSSTLNPASLGAFEDKKDTPQDEAVAALARELRRARANYATYSEMFFWAADDWGNMNPEKDIWRSGQSNYLMKKSNVKALIAMAHDHYGMKVATYGKHNAGGPDGFENFRRKPEWFLHSGQTGQPLGNGYDTESLDFWNDEVRRAPPTRWVPKSTWFFLYPDFRQVPPLDWGIDQISRSAKEYGWDAVRYDGHYTTGNDELSTWNIRRLKQTLGAKNPGFRFGYNYCYIPESGFTHEMREALANGGMWLNEAMKYLGYQNGKVYDSWLHYATNELAIVKRIQAAGGSYHASWNYREDQPPAKFLYLLIYGLIAGTHPAFTPYQDFIGCHDNKWGEFITRSSGYLWHPGLQEVDNPKSQVTVTNGGPLQWEPFMQEVVVNGARKLKIIHLVNPPPSDKIAEASLPTSAVYSIGVSLKLEPGTSVVRAAVYKPDVQGYGMGLTPSVQGDIATVTVNQITHWGFVVFELSGQFSLPAVPAAYTELPDATEVEEGRSENIGQLSNDPLLPPAKVTLKPGESLWETDEQSASINGIKVADADAANGWAMYRPRKSPLLYLGRTWMGPFPAGRYRARAHVKVDDDKLASPRVQTWVTRRWRRMPTVHVTEIAENPNYFERIDTPMVSPTLRTDTKDPAFQLICDGAYHYYDIPGWELTANGFVSLGGEAACAGVDPVTKIANCDKCAIHVDHFIIEQLELYTDDKLATWNTVTKPADLRTPNGKKPARTLLVTGMFWKEYDIDSVLVCDHAYQLPATYEGLYDYDAVVLCDVDLTTSSFELRKRLDDFVRDGGRLVILGGPYTLGVGAMAGTYLDAMSPFTIRGADEMVRHEYPEYLGPNAYTTYGDGAVVMWQHGLEAKPTATVEAYAGQWPIAACQPHGAGIAVAFLGTVLGEAPAGATPFWKCTSWRTLLDKLVLG